jgi:hypothetical protein
MTATYTFDVFCSLDGYVTYNSDGDWGGYWGKQGPKFLAHRLAYLSEDQRMVLGANTFREFVKMLGPGTEDQVISKNMPTTLVSTTLQRTRKPASCPSEQLRRSPLLCHPSISLGEENYVLVNRAGAG